MVRCNAYKVVLCSVALRDISIYLIFILQNNSGEAVKEVTNEQSRGNNREVKYLCLEGIHFNNETVPASRPTSWEPNLNFSPCDPTHLLCPSNLLWKYPFMNNYQYTLTFTYGRTDNNENCPITISNIKSNWFNENNTHGKVITDNNEIPSNSPIIEPILFPSLSPDTPLVRIPSVLFRFPKDVIQYIILVGPEIHVPIVSNNNNGILHDMEEVSLHIGQVSFC